MEKNKCWAWKCRTCSNTKDLTSYFNIPPKCKDGNRYLVA